MTEKKEPSQWRHGTASRPVRVAHSEPGQANTHVRIAPLYNDPDHRSLPLDKIVPNHLRRNGGSTSRSMICWLR